MSFTKLALKAILAGSICAISIPGALAEPLVRGLSDPALQPKFEEIAPNALDPGFLYKDLNADGKPAQQPNFSIKAAKTVQETGLIDPKNGRRLKTNVFGYGADTVSWPGQTAQVMSVSAGGADETLFRVENKLGNKHLLPVDTSLHWAYSLHGDSSANGVDYRQYDIQSDGIPIVTHLHGGFTDYEFDGNPEFFYSPDAEVKGPQWDFVLGGYQNTFRYNNDVPAGNLWYHDHALGITRLNVYAGLAGFYFVRDEFDTGLTGNQLGLPAFPYELAYAIQDRMFTDAGALFYPAFPGDPFYDDFITAEGVILPPDQFPGGGPTALAEFFGDHMVVNGKIWPKEIVEPRNYRMRLLNGCDSRFLVIQFRRCEQQDCKIPTGEPIPFHVIGSDQGLFPVISQDQDTLLIETGGRYDIIFDFSEYVSEHIIMENIGGDSPFGGEIPGESVYEYTNLIMAFDVTKPFDDSVEDNFNPNDWPTGIDTLNPFMYGDNDIERIRQVALFEGTDEYGRLQPLLGTAEPATDFSGEPLFWPDDSGSCPICLTNPDAGDCDLCPYYANNLANTQIEGTVAWHDCTTENPALGDTEEWWIWNVSPDAHPVHLHLGHFEIVGRYEIVWDSATSEDDRTIPEGDSPAGDGIYLVPQPVVQHNKAVGEGYKINFEGCNDEMLDPPSTGCIGQEVEVGDAYQDRFGSRKDVVTALPDQVTKIRIKFEKPGRYVWHCHILSHEDHEMMRVMHVGEGDPSQERCRMMP